MVGVKNKKRGGARAGKGGGTSTTATSITANYLLSDEDLVFGYFYLANYVKDLGNHEWATTIMEVACRFHPSSPLLHYWHASVAVGAAIDCHHRYGSERRETLSSWLCVSREAAHRAITMSPRDIEFLRFYIFVLAMQAILEKTSLDEASRACIEAFSIQDRDIVLEERLCCLNKEEIIKSFSQLYSKLQSPSERPDTYYRPPVVKKRSKQVGAKILMPEESQKEWRLSCWNSLSYHKKLDLLAVKFVDLKMFFEDELGEKLLMETFGASIAGESLKYWICKSCNTKFSDGHSRTEHVRTKHISTIDENLQELLQGANEYVADSSDSAASKFVLSIDTRKLILYICEVTSQVVSFELNHPIPPLPNPETFISWLNLDEISKDDLLENILGYELMMFKVLEKFYQVASHQLKYCKNYAHSMKSIKKAELLLLAELENVRDQKLSVLEFYETIQRKRNQELAGATGTKGDPFSVQSQIGVILSFFIQGAKKDLGKDYGVGFSFLQLEAHLTSAFKKYREQVAEKQDKFKLEAKAKMTEFVRLEHRMNQNLFVDLCKDLLPCLSVFYKARLADYVYAHAKEQTEKLAELLCAEEADDKVVCNPSKQLVKNPIKKTKKKKEKVPLIGHNPEEIHQEGPDTELQDCDSSIPQQEQEEQLQSESSVGPESKLQEVLECQRHLSDEMKQNIQQSEEENNTPLDTACQSESSVGAESKLQEVLECQRHLSDEMKQNIQQSEEENNTPLDTACQSESSVGPESKLQEVLECQRHPSDEMKQNIQHSEEETNTPINTVCQSESSFEPESKLHEVLECQGHPSDEMKFGKEAPSTSFATDASPHMFLDNDFLLGYFDLASYFLQSREHVRIALDIMRIACSMNDSHPLLLYWKAWFALEVFHEIYSDINYDREVLLDHLCIACDAARRATIISPYDIEFSRFYIESLAANAIFGECSFSEAIEASNRILNLPVETMVFQEKLCPTHNKEAIITAIRVLKEKCSRMEGNTSESPLSKPVPFYRRVDEPKEKQIAEKLFMPEMEQKKWRRSFWKSMSDDKKVEFLALKYEDLRTFFLDKHLDIAKEVLMETFSAFIYGKFLFLPHCYTCSVFFINYKSLLDHVRSQHILQLSEQLKELLPEEDTCEIMLPDTDDGKLSVSVDKAKLTLHICNGTKGEISFEPENLKSLLPDPETFVNWLNLDEYAEKKMDDIIAAEGVIFRLLNNNSNELKSLCLEKHEKFTMVEKALVLIEWHCLEELKKMNCQKSTVLELLKAVHENLNEKFKECPENVISIQHQFDVISDMIMSELDSTKDTEVLLSSDQLEVHMDLVFKSRKELLAKECESFDSKLREKNTLKNHLECELSCMCRFDYSKQLLPYLGLYIKAQLAELVLTYATEQADKLAEQLTMEEAKNNAPGGSNLSEQSVKNPNMKYRVSRAYDDYEVAHQQEGTTELFVPCRSVSALSANLRMKSGSSTTAYRWR